MSGKKSGLTKKERAKILVNQSLIAFTNQSTIITLPYTQNALEQLGAEDETSKLTTASGTVMGMIMCNGYSPLMIILFTSMYYHQLSFATILITVSLILILGISASGAGSADYTIILAILGTLSLPTSFYLGVLMPIQEVNEKIYPTVNNTAGHMFATQVSERLNSKK
jgi:Na+/H+-dicarboxylate symporter